MRDYVVNIGRHCDNSSLEALRTMGMLSDKPLTKFLPSVSVATASRIAFALEPPRLSSLRSQLVLLLASLFVSLAVLLTERNCTSASGISAELEEWHDIGLENKKGRASRLSPLILCAYQCNHKNWCRRSDWTNIKALREPCFA